MYSGDYMKEVSKIRNKITVQFPQHSISVETDESLKECKAILIELLKMVKNEKVV